MTTLATTRSPLRTLRLIAADIKIAHSVFAMPFALLAAFMAVPGSQRGAAFIQWLPFTLQIMYVIAAMILARSVAMLANRLLDAEIDRHNPRTAERAIPSGHISKRQAIRTMSACAAGFLLICAFFGLRFQNWWPLALGPLVLIWLGSYALLKRFTSFCHLYLGASLAMSPLAATIAVNPESILDPAIWLLSAMVLCWVAGFDIIYALQDVEVDRAQNLHSIPARLGIKNALLISRILHALAVAWLLVALVIDPRLHILFGAGIAIVAALLVYEHLTVARWGTSKIALAFFALNGVISCMLGILGILDVLW